MGTSTLSLLQPVLHEQWGLITRQQMSQRGVSPATIARMTHPDGLFERVASGVYRLQASPWSEFVDLRAAWLQLEPRVFAWERDWMSGVSSLRSALSLYGLGDLPVESWDFTVMARRQSARHDVRFLTRRIQSFECRRQNGMWVTSPSRTISDLLHDHEEPEAVARVAAEVIRSGLESPSSLAEALRTHERRMGIAPSSGVHMLQWLLAHAHCPEAEEWVDNAVSGLVRS